MKLSLLVLLLFQTPPLDDLLRDLSSENSGTRERATRQISERWKGWDERDLKKIEQAGRSGDSETAARVQTILSEIALRRRVPARVLEATPNLLQVLRAGSVDQILDLFDRIEVLQKEQKVSERDLIPVYIELLDDRRPTPRTVERFRTFDEDKNIEVRELAEGGLRVLISKPQLSGREAWRAWWEENRGKPAADWYLPDLAHPQAVIRVGAIQRLAPMKEASHYERIFAALRTLRDNRQIGNAIDALVELPREVLLRELRPILRDPHPLARLSAARILFDSLPDESVAAVVDALDKPEGLDFEGLDPENFRSGSETLQWLGGVRNPKAFDFIRRATKSKNSGLKDQAMWQLGRIEGPQALDALADMLDDPEVQNCSGQIHGASIDHPRFGDVAGIILASRLELKGPFNWICSKRERDNNLAVIRNGWRESKGLPALPLPSADPVPVAKEKVAPLVADLTADDEDRRIKATSALLHLGAGAWVPLNQSIAEASGKSRERLEAAALSFANALRSVVVKGDAEGLAAGLQARLHAPLLLKDLEALGDAWFHDPGLAEINVEVDRDREGRGISLVISIRKGPETTPPTSLGFGSRGSFGAGVATEDVFHSVWRKNFVDRFKAEILSGTGGYAYQWAQVDKRWK